MNKIIKKLNEINNEKFGWYLMTIFICITLIFCALTQRYDLICKNKGCCYKIDKLTGRVWTIYIGKSKAVVDVDQAREIEHKALLKKYKEGME